MRLFYYNYCSKNDNIEKDNFLKDISGCVKYFLYDRGKI